jgi:hypothetical protein
MKTKLILDSNTTTNNNNNNNNNIEAKREMPLNVLNNYFSIGTDAKISLDFHIARGIN